MAKYDENKIITALHPELAVVGQKYYFADTIRQFKDLVTNNIQWNVHTLDSICSSEHAQFPFKYTRNIDKMTEREQFIYPYEEQ